ncbi:gluconeogenesis factor YvcK family protein [Echinimonas agarilytica]|uniref:Putative gluconeogenesis factor n=1 Tax=Echinimonas agarilytica TaxID=1215918 RepID=A0AA41W5K7_9GAMM|nr:gluconeogenesis factor YvcK family protein [Echinimonas agarilytica]MCM2678868.1 YvcK family protein [Echinimonas agarilytica]
MRVKPKSIVTIGGGSGQYTLLSGIRDLPGVTTTAIVSMADSGGSTGILRGELGALPPGDVLKCILALSPHRDVAIDILLRRFSSSERLKDHNAGNMLLTMLSEYAGSFPDGIQALAEILNVKGNILPVTTDKVTLVAELANGNRVFGEAAIDVPRHLERANISKVFLVPHHGEDVTVHLPVIDAIINADVILLGPGDLYTSIVPNLLVEGLTEALAYAKAKKYFISNIMTKFGETQNYALDDYIASVERYMGSELDGVFYNNVRPSDEALARYAEQRAEFVELKQRKALEQRCDLRELPLLDDSTGVARHSPALLGSAIQGLLADLEQDVTG